MGYSNRIVHYMLLAIVSCDLLLGTCANVIDFSSQKQNVQSSEIANVDSELSSQPSHSLVHRIVKRKSKIGRGFGFGKSKPKNKNKNQPAYPKQPASNPNYNPGHMGGPPPAYPGQGSYPGNNRMNYPQNPPSYPSNPSYPSYPSYPSGGGGYGNTGFGGGGYNNGFNNRGFGKNSGGFGGGGLGKTIGSAGFGAIAGTALGAYGGYKLGRMIGSLGPNGHYGYYSDEGRYIKCDPPKVTKVDPETNITYIPLEEDYDKRCHYFDRRPPQYFRGYTNSISTTTTISYTVLLVTLLLSFFNLNLLNARNRIGFLAIAGFVILF